MQNKTFVFYNSLQLMGKTTRTQKMHLPNKQKMHFLFLFSAFLAQPLFIALFCPEWKEKMVIIKILDYCDHQIQLIC